MAVYPQDAVCCTESLIAAFIFIIANLDFIIANFIFIIANQHLP